MLGLKKSVALLAITVLLFTTLFAMVGAVLADEAGPSDQAGSTDVQVQENQTKPVDEIDNQVSQPVTSEPAGYQEPTLNVPVATTPTDNVENKVEQNTAAQTPPAIDQGGDQSAGSQNGDLPADNGSQYEDKVEVNKPLESNGGNTENGLNSESESRNSEGRPIATRETTKRKTAQSRVGSLTMRTRTATSTAAKQAFPMFPSTFQATKPPA